MPTTNCVSSPTLLEFTEKELDELFNTAFEQYKNNCNSNRSIATTSKQSSEAPTRNFAKAISSKEVDEAIQGGILKKTQEDSIYCANLWKEWVIHRAKTTGVVIPHLKDMKVEELQNWICAFVLEIRERDWSTFIPNSLHHICAGIMRYLRDNGMPEIDTFKQAGFSRFRMLSDSEMKRLQASGIGTAQRKAKPIIFEDEDILWRKRNLDDSTTQSLLNTMLYMNGL